jgi:hypothetical protein
MSKKENTDEMAGTAVVESSEKEETQNSKLAEKVKSYIDKSYEVNTKEDATALTKELDNEIRGLIEKQSELQAKNIEDIQGLEYVVQLNIKSMKKMLDIYGKSIEWNSLKDAYLKAGQVAKLEEMYITARNVANLPENTGKDVIPVKIKAVDAHIVTQLIESTSGKGYYEAKTFIKTAADIAASFKTVFEEVKKIDNKELSELTAEISALQSVLYDSIIPKFKMKGFFDFANEAIEKLQAENRNKLLK